MPRRLRSANLVMDRQGKESDAHTTEEQPYKGGAPGSLEVYNGRGSHVDPVK
jgi:hypothetical protein